MHLPLTFGFFGSPNPWYCPTTFSTHDPRYCPIGCSRGSLDLRCSDLPTGTCLFWIYPLALVVLNSQDNCVEMASIVDLKVFWQLASVELDAMLSIMISMFELNKFSFILACFVGCVVMDGMVIIFIIIVWAMILCFITSCKQKFTILYIRLI